MRAQEALPRSVEIPAHLFEALVVHGAARAGGLEPCTAFVQGKTLKKLEDAIAKWFMTIDVVGP